MLVIKNFLFECSSTAWRPQRGMTFIEDAVKWREHLEKVQNTLIWNTKRRSAEFKKAKSLSGFSSSIVFIFPVSSALLCFALLRSEPFFHHPQPISGAKPLQRITYEPRDDSPSEGWEEFVLAVAPIQTHPTQRSAAPPRIIGTSRLNAAGWTSGWDRRWACQRKPEASESGCHALFRAVSHFATWILTRARAASSRKHKPAVVNSSLL